MHTNTIVHAIRHFAHEHDELPAFHAGYLVLSVLAAAMLNLGAFAVLIAAHVSLDIVKYREVHHLSWRGTVEGTFRESLLDMVLFVVALTFSVYLHHTIGMIAMSGVVRADLTLARVAGVFLPKFEILERFLSVFLHLGRHLRTVHERLGEAFAPGEQLFLFLLIASLILLIAAPAILGITTASFLATLGREMIPWQI